ncbi:MAG: HEAT repeat domain-containing protein [Planctomycetes bacterium]|nr:HEAT repeat domain-containing protein [Planctomycetota bacterium]
MRPTIPGGPTTESWASDLSSWRVWWRFNQDEFIELQSHLDRMDLATGSEEFFRDAGSDSVDRRRSGPADADERIVPALLAALRRDATVDASTSAMIALARVGERPAADGSTPHAAAIAPLLRHSHQEVAETAALSLGILGANSPRNVDLLTRLVGDDRDGLRKLHALAFASPISERTRAFGTYGLGLLGERSRDVFVRRWIVRSLHDVLTKARADRSRELSAAAITALGLVALEPAAERRPSEDSKAPQTLEEQFALLFEVYLDERIENVVRAHAPMALARLIERGRFEPAWRDRVAKRLIAELASPARGDALLQRSAVQALGRIARATSEPLDIDMRAALLGALDSRDLFVRRFALVALARAGSSVEDAAVSAAASDEVRSRLLAELADGKSGSVSWAALALGVLERRLQRAGGTASPRTLAALLHARKSARGGEERGALAVALGLVGDPAARDPLQAALSEERSPENQGDLALALGLLGDRSALEPIRAILARARYQPNLLHSAAIGLGLLGDVKLVPDLVELLARSSTQASQGAVASALGLIGDSRSVEPLLALSESEDVTAGARAFALVALGMVGDRALLPWRATLASDFNYTAATATLLTPETSSGVLDIL